MAIQTFRPTIGGAELQLERLLPHLERRGVRSKILTRAVRGRPRREPLSGGIIVRTALAGESAAASVVYVAQSLWDTLIHRSDTDIVHAHGALSPATIALGARALGIPCVVTVLGTGIKGDLTRLARKPAGKFRLKQLVRQCWFIALSHEIRAELESLGVSPERIFAIPNGVDPGVSRRSPTELERDALRRRLAIPQNVFVGIFVGRLLPVKRVDRLLHGLVHVPNVHLLILGDGAERATLQQVAREADVADRVTFVGFSDRVPDYLRASDAFFLPSAGEGMSNALVEAMACGLPCVATSHVGGVGELLGGERGIVLESGEATEWAAAMTTLAEDSLLRRSIGQAAADYAASTLSLDAVADRLVHAYRHVINADAARRRIDRRRAPVE
jgi:glycosyltransferase involved in cell wall biosynthesis